MDYEGARDIADARAVAEALLLDLADDDCLRLTPDAECPADGAPRCVGCVWRPWPAAVLATVDDQPDPCAGGRCTDPEMHAEGGHDW